MSSTIPPPIDLDAYFARVGFAGPAEPTLATLTGLHLAHATHIPFENLDILLGRPIRLDLESLQAKMVAGRRGGYCFEQNTLFAAVLERVGFAVTPYAARVRLGATQVNPRTHMLVHVDIAGADYLADVGFGGECLLGPLPLAPGVETQQYGRVFRLLEDAGLWVLQLHRGGSWEDLYAFTREPQLPVDFEVANHYTSTHPRSIFVQHPYVQLTTPAASYRLFDRKLSVRQGEEVTSRELADDAEMLQVLDATFGLDFMAGTRFAAAVDPAVLPA
jgi:N-hydroxyarylamine O-acetyltransferase